MSLSCSFILINLLIYCNRILLYSPASLELVHHDGLEPGDLSASTISVLELKSYITISGFPLLVFNYHYFMYMDVLPTCQSECQVLLEAKREHQISWKWNYRCL